MAAKKRKVDVDSIYRLDVLSIKDNVESRMRNTTYQQLFDRVVDIEHEDLEDTKMIIHVSLNNVNLVTYHFHSVSLYKLAKQLSQYA